jgi:hypothetical protein
MLSNRLAFVAVALASIAAAAGGGYLATRQNLTSSTMAASTPVATAASTSAAPSARPDALVGTAPVPTTNSVSGPAPAAPPLSKRNGTKGPSPQPLKADKAATTARNTALPAIDTWPGSQTSVAATQQDAPQLPAPAPLPEASAPAVRQDDIRPQDQPRGLEPEKAPEQTSEKQLAELVISANSVIGLQLETALTSERAHVEDRVDARVIRDVRVPGGQVAVPAGAHAIGSVMLVEQGGKFKAQARLGIRFNTLVLPDGTRLPISTETIYRLGDPPSNGSAAKIGGGAVVGTILGGILGGAKGAAVGAAAGAGGGAAATAAGNRSVVTLAVGTQMTARFLSPVTVVIEK